MSENNREINTQITKAEFSASRSAPEGNKKIRVTKKKITQLKGTTAKEFFHDGQFFKEFNDWNSSMGQMTGFSNLDAIQPMYPGLYALGAMPGLGATSFALQLADQIAAQGDKVLYFSLMQDHYDMYTRSLARSFFFANQAAKKSDIHSKIPTPSGTDIANGCFLDYQEIFKARVKEYVDKVDTNLSIADSLPMTLEDIVNLVDEYIQEQHAKPVVIIDNLQAIKPDIDSECTLDRRTIIDNIIYELKHLQSKHHIPIVLICSLNRSSYSLPIDFASFKDSGSIENTADVVWGLQLSVLSSPVYMAERSVNQRHAMFHKANTANPRKVDLVCLKNRFGLENYAGNFNYFPNSEAFVPAADTNSKQVSF